MTFKDTKGGKRSVSQPFTLDDSRFVFDFWRRYILTVPHALVVSNRFSKKLFYAIIGHEQMGSGLL